MIQKEKKIKNQREGKNEKNENMKSNEQ